MGLIALLCVLILAPLGICAAICCAGWFATVKPRLEHQREMFRLSEQAKLNAVTVEERRMGMLEVGRQEWP